MDIYLLHMGEALPADIRAAWEQLLGASRRERLRSFVHPVSAERSLCGEVLARYALARRLGCAPSSLCIAAGASGKPYLLPRPGGPSPVPQFSISHAGRYAACAVAEAPVGLDVEVKEVAEKLEPWFCHPAERRALRADPDPARLRRRLWTLKESWVKCLESGVGRHMADLDLSDGVAGAGEGDVGFALHGFVFRSLLIPGGALAVCLQG